MQFQNKYETEVQPAHELICLPNAASFNNNYFNHPLTTFAQGWRDPSDLEAELEFVAPLVEVPRRFQWRKFDEKNDFLIESDDARAIGGDFKRVKVEAELTDSHTVNRGLTMFIDLDQVSEMPDWEQRYTEYLLRRGVRNDLYTAVNLLVASATDLAKTWNAEADPDADIMDMLDTAGDAMGFNPNRAYMGANAWSKRVKAFRAQDNAGAQMSARMTPDDILQNLKNQRYWPNPDTLDEDLTHAIGLIQILCETNAKYLSAMMELMAAIEDTTGMELGTQ